MTQEKAKQIISIVIPCHNEEQGIGHVLDIIPHEKLHKAGFATEVIVVDNKSTDKTAEVALQHGARVIEETHKGKGKALKTGLAAVDPKSNFIVIVDGDDTYKLHEIFRMIEPLDNDFCDIVVGSRLSGRMLDKAFSEHHRIANWAFTFMVRHFYKANITDTLSGFISMKKKVSDDMLKFLTSHDFRIEMELITKSVKLGYNLTSVPITYDKRRGKSKLASYSDGLKILRTLLSNFTWKPSTKK